MAINEELEAHRKNATWSIVERPSDKKLLSTKWVFKIKRRPNGSVERYMARLVTRGFEQRVGYEQALKLQKGLHGLKQAPRVWNNKYKQVVEAQGFRPTQSDSCLFPHSERRIL